MKKILIIGFASVVIVTALFGFGGNKSESLEPTNVKNNEKVVFTATDENLKDNGTISDGIHYTSTMLNASLENVSSFSEINGIETIENYMNGAIKLAEERNAALSIKNRLYQSSQLIQQAISEQDINKLHKADKILSDLDLEFNEGVINQP
jgi:hypothetical protein